MRTLILSGVMDERQKLRLQIPFPGDLPRPTGAGPTSDDVVEAAVLDKDDNVVGRGLLDVRSLCVMPAGNASKAKVARAVNGAIPFPDGGTTLRLTWRGRTIHQAHAT